MKKLIALLLVAVMCFSFTSCGENSAVEETKQSENGIVEKAKTQEEMVSIASTVYEIAEDAGITVDNFEDTHIGKDIGFIEKAKDSNYPKFKLAYQDKFCVITGNVFEIHEDYCWITSVSGSSTYGGGVKIHLPLETLASLEKLTAYTFVGQIFSIEDYPIRNGQNDGCVFEMTDAYVLSDRFEVTGKIHSINKDVSYEYYDDDPPFNFQIGDSSYLQLVHFSNEVETSQLDWNNEITISAKYIWGRYCDAVIVE